MTICIQQGHPARLPHDKGIRRQKRGDSLIACRGQRIPFGIGQLPLSGTAQCHAVFPGQINIGIHGRHHRPSLSVNHSTSLLRLHHGSTIPERERLHDGVGQEQGIASLPIHIDTASAIQLTAVQQPVAVAYAQQPGRGSGQGCHLSVLINEGIAHPSVSIQASHESDTVSKVGGIIIHCGEDKSSLQIHVTIMSCVRIDQGTGTREVMHHPDGVIHDGNRLSITVQQDKGHVRGMLRHSDPVEEVSYPIVAAGVAQRTVRLFQSVKVYPPVRICRREPSVDYGRRHLLPRSGRSCHSAVGGQQSPGSRIPLTIGQCIHRFLRFVHTAKQEP